MENTTLSSHYECRDNIVDVSEQLEKIESMIADPASFINESFDTIDKHISWRRSSLILDINSYCDQLTEQSRLKRSQCLLSSDTEDMEKIVCDLKEELAHQRRQFSTSVNKTRLDLIQNSVLYVKERLKQLALNYRESLLMKQELEFVYRDQLIEDVFGIIIENKQVCFCILVTVKYHNVLQLSKS